MTAERIKNSQNGAGGARYQAVLGYNFLTEFKNHNMSFCWDMVNQSWCNVFSSGRNRFFTRPLRREETVRLIASWRMSHQQSEGFVLHGACSFWLATPAAPCPMKKLILGHVPFKFSTATVSRAALVSAIHCPFQPPKFPSTYLLFSAHHLFYSNDTNFAAFSFHVVSCRSNCVDHILYYLH